MKHIRQSLMLLCLLIILTGIIYPCFITLMAQLVFPKQANGSLIYANHQVIGSSLVGQNFKSDIYFHPRPSVVNYNPIQPATGSNLGPTSKKLKELVIDRLLSFESTPPSDLVYASASGIDPHISKEAALFQLDRVAKARHLKNIDDLSSLVKSHALQEKGGYVNVLLLNIDVDKHFPLEALP